MYRIRLKYHKGVYMIWKTTIYAFVRKGLLDQVVVVISQAHHDTKLGLVI